MKAEVLYKLTDQDGYTRRNLEGETRWCKGYVLKVASKKQPRLCSKDVIHAYRSPHLALLLNPQHAGICDPLLWEARGRVVVSDWGKVGAFKLTIINQMIRPDWYESDETRLRVMVAFSVLCAEAVIHIYENEYPQDDRPRKAIIAAQQYLKDAPYAASHAAAYATHAAYAAYAATHAAAYAVYAASDAAYATHVASYAAFAAAHATHAAAYAVYAASDAAHAAYAASHAARVASYAAYAATHAADDLDFAVLAGKAVEMVLTRTSEGLVGK